MMTANEIIEKFQLIPHPEGGFYRETYRSEKTIRLDNKKERNASTAIYYLLKDADKSLFHRIDADEIWTFHFGESIEISVINSEGKIETKILSNQIMLGEEPQTVIKANKWFSAKLKDEKGYALVSCIVAPGFDFRDFEIADKKELMRSFPNIQKEIEEMYR